MGNLRNPTEVEQFENYSLNDYWLSQKCDRFWLGIFTHQTIAQNLVIKLVVGFDVWDEEILLQHDM